MFIIKVKNVEKDGTSSIEEHTAADKSQRFIKYYRIILRWLEILCPHFDWSKFLHNFNRNFTKYGEHCEVIFDSSEILVDYITHHLNLLNKQDNGKRSFCIEVIEVD